MSNASIPNWTQPTRAGNAPAIPTWSGTATAALVSLFQLKAGTRPAGGYFTRFGVAYESRDTGTADAYPNSRWHQAVAATGFICALGDSITQGFSAPESYFPKCWRANFATRQAHVANMGVNSARLIYATDTTLEINTIRTTYVSPAFNTMKGIFILFSGTNDIRLDGKSAPQTYIDMKVVTAGLRASHPNAKIIVVTPLPRENNGGFETTRQAYRTLILGGDTSYDYVADWGGDATMAANAASSANATYYADQVHPTDAGHVIGATYVSPKIVLALAALGI